MAAVPTQAAYQVCAETQNTYDVAEILAPVWEGDTCYQESVLPVAGAYGGDITIPLLYSINRVLEVQNAALTVTYQEGRDYSVKDGELVVHWQGDIPMMSRADFYPTDSPFANLEDGGYLAFGEGAYFHNKQIVVSYTHKSKYDGYVPENKGHLLPKLHQKLVADGSLDLFVLGDSISVGANSSGFSDIHVSPYLPIYPQLFADGLQQGYALKNVNLYNHSVGGKTSGWGMAHIEEMLAEHQNVDLAILAFGMNDGSLSVAEFNTNLTLMLLAVQERFPNAEILLVAPMLPNPKSSFNQNQAQFASGLLELESEGVAVADVTSVHQSLLARKAYADMTGNNINHPNDYLARVYAQTLLATVQKKNGGQPDGASRGCGAVTESAFCAPILAASAVAFIRKKANKNRRKR